MPVLYSPCRVDFFSVWFDMEEDNGSWSCLPVGDYEAVVTGEAVEGISSVQFWMR